MRKFLIGVSIAAFLLPVSVAGTAGRHCVGGYCNPKDGACNYTEAPCNYEEAPYNNTGAPYNYAEAPYEYSQEYGNGIRNYTDNNNDGICDYYGTGHHGGRHHNSTGYGYDSGHGCHR